MIKPGQIYRAADGSGTLIRIVGKPTRTSWGGSRVDIETVRADGRGIRRRSITTDALHIGDAGAWGKPRRTGYVLVPDSAHTLPDSTGHDRTPADSRPDNHTDSPDDTPDKTSAS